MSANVEEHNQDNFIEYGVQREKSTGEQWVLAFVTHTSAKQFDRALVSFKFKGGHVDIGFRSHHSSF